MEYLSRYHSAITPLRRTERTLCYKLALKEHFDSLYQDSSSIYHLHKDKLI
jgi:hypothetical protein